MTDDEILDEFRAADALLEGHFILSSGLRSPRYLQCARVLMDPARAERLARALAEKIPPDVRGRIDSVVSPAMGGVIIGHEMGRALGNLRCSWSVRKACSNFAEASAWTKASACYLSKTS